MTSVVIAAHDEEAVLGATLDVLLAEAEAGEFDVVVSANACTDRTAAVARSRGVRVVESPLPGKTGAINRAEAGCTDFPRAYLDADIKITTADLRRLSTAVSGGTGALVALPSRRLVTEGRPLLVRAYFAVQQHLPAFENGLFGRGLVVVSREGRSRFDRFPDVVADDLFLDSLFLPKERVHVPEVATVVETPLRTRDLIARLVRVRRGNRALRARTSGTARVRPSDQFAFVRDVVLPRPWLAPAAVAYAGISLIAELLSRRGPVDSTAWGRDASTRTSGRLAS